MFDIPVCLFTWKRIDTVIRIIDVLKMVRPTKLYIYSDGPRNQDEKVIIDDVRKQIISLINWPCEIIQRFNEKNEGVYKQIGLGALDIFQNEEKCIFIEDDNLPNISFFNYCKQALEKYKNDENVMLICGTNYKGTSSFDEFDAYLTKALLPCGWASWSSKFSKFYMKDLSKFENKIYQKEYIKKYKNKPLAHQQLDSILSEIEDLKIKGRYRSWDYHLIASIMMNDLYVVSPRVNLIRNIGVDDISIHDVKKIGNKNPMTKRFCEVPTYELNETINFPPVGHINEKYQKYCDKIILYPLKLRVKRRIYKILKALKLK